LDIDAALAFITIVAILVANLFSRIGAFVAVAIYVVVAAVCN
jgi:hypothetical protein